MRRFGGSIQLTRLSTPNYLYELLPFMRNRTAITRPPSPPEGLNRRLLAYSASATAALGIAPVVSAQIVDITSTGSITMPGTSSDYPANAVFSVGLVSFSIHAQRSNDQFANVGVSGATAHRGVDTNGGGGVLKNLALGAAVNGYGHLRYGGEIQAFNGSNGGGHGAASFHLATTRRRSAMLDLKKSLGEKPTTVGCACR